MCPLLAEQKWAYAYLNCINIPAILQMPEMDLMVQSESSKTDDKSCRLCTSFPRRTDVRFLPRKILLLSINLSRLRSFVPVWGVGRQPRSSSPLFCANRIKKLIELRPEAHLKCWGNGAKFSGYFIPGSVVE